MPDPLRDDQRLTELGLLAAVVAHDFNNVLSIIRGCASILRILPGLTSAQTQELDGLDGGIRHGMELVQQVYAYTGNTPALAGEVDLNKAVAQMAWMLRRLGRSNVTVELILGSGIGPVKAEEVQVEQVLLNLAINARDAMPEGGRLLIETADVPPGFACAPPLPSAATGGYMRLIVSDTGVGILPEARARMFEPFFTTKRGGTGLGLFSIRRIVRQCGGHIRFRSLPQKGTTFEIYFPRAGAPAGHSPL
jgi:two-component system cell cycle sensor histidine kinase/response regulator CckA